MNATHSPPAPAPTDDTAHRPQARAILVVDDHELVRMGVRALVEARCAGPDANVAIYEAANLADALSIYERAQNTIDLVLLDIALPDTQGLSGLTAFRARFPAARVVVLSGTGGTSLAQGGVVQAALALGATAFVPKSGDLREVVNFIRGWGLCGDAPAGHARSPDSTASAPTGRLAQALTPRQVQVLQWMLEGKANKEIAQLACLSEGTVKNYVSTILLQFGMRSRAQLISSLR